MILKSWVVKDLYTYMSKKYNTKIKYKPNAIEAVILGKIVSKVTPLTYKQFMENYAFVIPPNIYLPFEPGERTDKFSLVQQIAACGHEHAHIVHANNMGRFSFAWKYITSRAFRTQAEYYGYGATMELVHYFTGKLADPKKYAAKLYDYRCDEEDVAIAEGVFARHNKLIARGLYTTQTAKDIINWLKDNVNA